MSEADVGVRSAGAADADVIGRLLHDFNTEYDEITPGPEALANRVRELLAGEDFAVRLVGSEPRGLVVLRFRPSIWTPGLECYVAELYVQPEHRRQGLGLALMNAALAAARAQGADYVEVATSEDDTGARALYERLGFVNRERGPDGPVMLVYERELLAARSSIGR
jgi:ribosomal protein S18 acetylase RimI-like enzyme